MIVGITSGLLLFCFGTGCRSSQSGPDLSTLYNRAAQYHGPERNPIILIPGILGTKLTHQPTQTTTWGAFSGNFADPETPDGARQVALPMRVGHPLSALRDSVYPDGALEQVSVRVLGLPFELSAYVDIMQALGIGGYRDESGALSDVDYGDEHFTCFQFDYDWRRDNVENAQRLHAFIQEKRKYVQQEYAKRYGLKEYPVTFDLIAHSMGGLLARYYLRYGGTSIEPSGPLPEVTWEGAQYVDRAILVGTPNAGAIDALDQLVHGKRTSRFTPSYSPAVLGTMPAIYQLLPRGRHGVLVDARDSTLIDSLYAPVFWERMNWGLADPDQDDVLKQLLPGVSSRAERRAIALDHQAKSLRRAKQFAAALDAPVSRPANLDLYLIAGDAEPTLQTMTVDRTTGRLQTQTKTAGDGTVTRSSALMDERKTGSWNPVLVSPIDWTHVTFLFASHVEMTRDAAFTDNLLYILLVHP